ncbi:gag-pol fusion protein [Penaeus vannamei]|uniref:Gag-pol fusion protein n=1 Tax=Penaeus vannamei TaxID=6689 RepID=A0A3R7PFX9_PENVA|nr:gag-pol fusion protein [Penaeus vannamei]
MGHYKQQLYKAPRDHRYHSHNRSHSNGPVLPSSMFTGLLSFKTLDGTHQTLSPRRNTSHRRAWCEYHRLEGHNTSECRANKRVCYGCGEPGHFLASCPFRTSRPGQKPNPQAAVPVQGRSPTKKAMLTLRGRPQVILPVNDRKITCFIDTGSEVTVLKEEAAKLLPGIRMLRSSRTLKGVAGMPKSVEAEADLKFTIHPGLDLVHRTCITSGIHFPGDMLVGMDLLRRLPVVIFISPNSSDSYLELDGHRHVVTFVGEESSHCCEVPACHESRGELPESSIPLQPRYVSPVHVTEATTIEPRAGRFVAASLSRSVPDETHVAVIEGNAARLLVPAPLLPFKKGGQAFGWRAIRSPDYACPVGNSVADPEPNPDTPLLEVPPSVQDQQMQEPQPHQMPNLTTLASQQMREQQLQDPVCTDLIAWLERPQLHTDNGLEFSSDEWRSLLKELEVRHSFSVAYHPQSNGVVERSNRVVKDALAALVQQSPSQWPIHLPAVRFALNSAIHRSTSDQPLYLLTGRMALFPRGLTNLQTIDEGQMVNGRVAPANQSHSRSCPLCVIFRGAGFHAHAHDWLDARSRRRPP